ncbi:hypothetical protein [Allofournierella massiliensis]|uniref:Uncharacterized protein n=1 Tax=Allofournierella massiliensis TaxID=1650663 RepID=A0A4R1QRC8_9FIRM|nr:hypothetical protein [Fournierella massiliensis]TCL56358.1 hypothetical protein EDD77_11316 [Fournierella massiliensis]
MGKREELLRRYEKLSRAAMQDKPDSCKRYVYYRPDFKYRRCQFSRCPYGKQTDVFRQKPLKRDKFS